MCSIVFAVSLIVSVGLIIGGFFVPPTGVIDGSVLKAVGELIAFPALSFGYRAIELGYDVKVQHGQTHLTVSNDIEEKEDGEVLQD